MWLLWILVFLCSDFVHSADSETQDSAAESPSTTNKTQSPTDNNAVTTQSPDSNLIDENTTTGQKTHQNSTETHNQVTSDNGYGNFSESGNNVTAPPNTTKGTNITENGTVSQITKAENQTHTTLQPDEEESKEPLNETVTTAESGGNSTVSMVTSNEGLNTKNTTHESQQSYNLSTTPPSLLNTSWMKLFLPIKRFDGWYMYNDGKFLFDFVPRFVHPTDSQTLVATFYDEDGAVIDMNGTSNDGQFVTFTSSIVYSQSYRFSKDLVLQLNGSVSNKGDIPVYSGAITLPKNSSFGRFHMQKGIEKESIDEQNSKTATIIAVVSCLSFLFVAGTAAFVCWVAKKGYLEKQHKHYRLFHDSAVTYETDAETVHI